MNASVPARPVVVHLLESAGAYSEVWLDAQISSAGRYRSTAWRLEDEAEPYRWVSRSEPLTEVSTTASIAVRLWVSSRCPLVARPVGSLLTTAAKRCLPRADVFHAHYGPTAWKWLGLIRTLETPLVVSFYGFDASKQTYRKGPWKKRYDQVFNRASAVIAEGPAMAARISGLGCPDELIHIVRLPFTNVELDSVDATDRRWTAVMAGRFVDKKGFDVGLRAFAKAFPKAGHLLLVGEGERHDDLRLLARELGIDQRVTFQPPVELRTLAAMLAASEVALFPSRLAPDGDGEGGAPLTLTLAQSVGTPVVVTDHDDLPFAAAPGSPIVGEGDVDGLAAALRDMLATRHGPRTDEVLARRRFVEEAHHPEHVSGMRETIYDMVRAYTS